MDLGSDVTVLSKLPATALQYSPVLRQAPDLSQSHIATGRAPRNSQTSLPKLFIPVFYLLPVQASPSLPRYSAAALCSCSPSQQLTGEATFSKGSVLAYKPVTDLSLHTTSQCCSPAFACNIPFLPASLTCLQVPPVSRYYLPTLSPTYLPAGPTHLAVGITHLPAGITYLPASITHLLPGTTHLSRDTLFLAIITHLLANFIPCWHHTPDS